MVDLIELKRLTENFNLLYVEDDDILQRKTTPIFERFFKKVDTASDGKEGLERYQSHKDETGTWYDIIISDIQMPKMNGIELSKHVLQLNPEQKIIITSAYNEKEYLIELINIGVAGFFQKPIENQSMFQVLHDVCASLLGNSSIQLGNAYRYDFASKSLFRNNRKVELTLQEQKLLDLLCRNTYQYFTEVDIFNHIHYDEDKKVEPDYSVKNLIEYFNKKTEEDLIVNTPQLGYCIKAK